MKIYIASGVGSGPTKVSAFDSALLEAGIGNYNLIGLSSMIPPDSEVVEEDLGTNKGNYGDKVYVVLAKGFAEIKGGEAWAGLGWSREKSSGKGVFIEGSGSSEEEVRSDLEKSFDSMRENRPEDLREIKIRTCGGRCEGDMVCAIVAAVYGVEK